MFHIGMLTNGIVPDLLDHKANKISSGYFVLSTRFIKIRVASIKKDTKGKVYS